MAMKFVKLQMKRMPSVKGWYLQINSLTDLWIYHMQYRLSINTNAFTDLVQSKEGHCKNELAVKIDTMSKLKQTSWVKMLNETNDKVLKNQAATIARNIPIFINENGGYTYHENFSEIYNVLDEKNVDVGENPQPFPRESEYTQKDIRIIKWDGGKHYYAKIGNFDVVVNDEQKWDSESEARRNAEKFLETL
jgi:hypothetical protein